MVNKFSARAWYQAGQAGLSVRNYTLNNLPFRLSTDNVYFYLRSLYYKHFCPQIALYHIASRQHLLNIVHNFQKLLEYLQLQNQYFGIGPRVVCCKLPIIQEQLIVYFENIHSVCLSADFIIISIDFGVTLPRYVLLSEFTSSFWESQGINWK